MSLQTFFNNFSLLADAPNGVAKLRDLVLQLAVRGKLLPQDEQTEPASLLLAKIKAEEKSLIRKKEIKEPKPLPNIEADELPYQIPSSWEWVRLGEVGQIVGGGTPSTEHPEYFADDGLAWLTPADLYKFKGKYIGKGKKDISARGLEKSSAQLMPAGTVLFSSRAPIGYVAIASNALTTNQGFKSCIPFVPQMSEYLYYFLKAVAKQLDEAASGTTFKEVPGKQFRLVLLPLPPLEEQKRIVAKVDELMHLCDGLDARQQANRESRVRLNNVTLAPLNNAASLAPEEFEQASARLADNFATLYDFAETVGRLRSTILQLAVQGKLVPQDPNEEFASNLFERIKNEKARLIKEGKIKKEDQVRPLVDEHAIFDLPSNWIWCRWQEVALQIGDVDHKMPGEVSNGIPYISPRDFLDGNKIDFANAKKISIKDFENLRRKIQPQRNDIIFPRYGTIGENRLVETNIDFLASYSCAVVKNLNGFIEPLYSFYYSLSGVVKAEIERYINKTTQANVGVKSIKSFLFPLPPLEEQKRIVAKVNQLMALCDELETKLLQTEADSEKLMKAAVRDLLASIAGKEKSQRETALALSSV